MSGHVWAVVEQLQGNPTDAAFEVLALGRELADALEVSLEAVILGEDVGGSAATLGVADRVLALEHAALAAPIGDIAARAVAALAAERGPQVVLLPITNLGWDLIGLLPARMGCPMVNFVHDAAVTGGRVEVSSLVYGGKMNVTVALPEGPVVLAVQPGTRPAEAGRVAGSPPLDRIAAVVDVGPISFVGYREPDAGDVDLTQQEVLIGVGRGIESEANLEVAEGLAEALGGAVCGSRPVIDQGWLPMARQVGKSGVTVKPRVYIAAGISGAPEHIEGMKDAELIVAFNTDPDAPIFGAAHYGAVGDATDLMEALALAVAERKG